MSKITKELGSGMYYALRGKDYITVYAIGAMPCLNWDARLEQRPERIFPPMFALYFYQPNVCLRAVKPFFAHATFGVAEDAKIESIIVTDIGGDNTVPVVPEVMPQRSEAMGATRAADQYIVIARVLTKYSDCRIIPADNLFIATHFKAFGPASKAACEAWVAKNCKG